MARFKDPYARLGEVDNETTEEGRRRRRREYQNEVDDRALDLVKNDPEVAGDMRKAKAKARELIALERAYARGEPLDDDSKTKQDAPSPKGKRRSSTGRRSTAASPGRRRPKSGRAGQRMERFATKSVNMVAAPYGSAASAAWTIGMGGLSLVLLYSLLSREGSTALRDLFNGISSGFRRFSDPWTPLFPTRGESAPPGPKEKPVQLRRTGNQAFFKAAVRHPARAGGPQQ